MLKPTIMFIMLVSVVDLILLLLPVLLFLLQTIPRLCSDLAQLQDTYILQGIMYKKTKVIMKSDILTFFCQFLRRLRLEGYAAGVLH